MAKSERNPHPEIGAPVIQLDLEAQIALAEQAVITRDARIRRRADTLAIRVKRDAMKHAGSGLAVGVGSLVLAWWLNRLNRKNAPPPAPAATAPPEPPSSFEHLFRDVAMGLASLLPMLWPVMPRGLRRSVTPGTASSLLTFVAPLLGRLFRRKPREAEAT